MAQKDMSKTRGIHDKSMSREKMIIFMNALIKNLGLASVHQCVHDTGQRVHAHLLR